MLSHNKEILRRYAAMVTGRPFAPILLNVLITSVCDMRCVHCFFTDELDDKERKKKQMTTANLIRISETMDANLGVLIVAGGEPFTRKDLPEVAGAFHRNNQLESIYLMSNGQIQQRIIPDVTRILEENPKLNVTVALGIDGLESDHDKIRQKPGSWARVIDTARKLKEIQKQYRQLDVQTCTCFMNSNQDRIFEWYDFLKYDLKPDKVNVNYIRPPSARPEETVIDHARYQKLSHMINEDSRSAAIKNNYAGEAGFFKAAIDVYMHDLIAKTALEGKPQLRCWAGNAGAVIYDEGTISSCEILDPVANLRDYDWNFSKFWYSDAMTARRAHVANGCFCTHESNCYYPSLAFNPKHLVNIKRVEWEMKRAAEALAAAPKSAAD